MREKPVVSTDLKLDFLSFPEAVAIYQEFFSQRQLNTAYVWKDLRSQYHEINYLLDSLYYRDEWENFLEQRLDMVKEMIAQRLEAHPDWAVLKKSNWEQIVLDSHADMEQVDLALCLIGMEGGLTMHDLLLPFLSSPERRQRWISARFLGYVQEEQALPVLLEMLCSVPTEADIWEYFWHLYAPRLLRLWPDDVVIKPLAHALIMALDRERHVASETDLYRIGVAEMAYELGRRGDLSVISTLDNHDKHWDWAIIDLLRGFIPYQQAYSLSEEQEYRSRSLHGNRQMQADVLHLLQEVYGYAAEIAATMIESYMEENRFNFL